MNKQELINYLKQQNFSDEIINAFEKVSREDFISKELKELAYENIPLSIGYNATISQPYTIAFMLNLLELDKLNEKPKILEIGSGSGYVLALISEINKNAEIYGIEIIKELAEKSKKQLKNYKNIKVINENALKSLDSPKSLYFDRILVSASAQELPKELVNHLNSNGILVIPIKQSIFRIKKQDKQNKIEEFPGFLFVPLKE